MFFEGRGKGQQEIKQSLDKVKTGQWKRERKKKGKNYVESQL